MTKYLKYFIISMFRNKNLIFFGLFFVLISLIPNISSAANIVSSTSDPYIRYLKVLNYVGRWYGLAILVSFSIVSSGLAQMIYFNSSAVVYLNRYSKLSVNRYYFESMLGAMAVFGIYAFVILSATIVGYSHVLKENLFPVRLPMLVLFTMLAGLFYFSFSFSLQAIAISLKKVRLMDYLAYLPIALTFILGYIQVNTSINISYLVYLSPLNSILGLLIYGYSRSSLFSVEYLLITSLLYILLFQLLSIWSLKRLKEVRIEDKLI